MYLSKLSIFMVYLFILFGLVEYVVIRSYYGLLVFIYV